MSKEEALVKMRKLVTTLASKTDAAPFREPVDWKEMELYDYPIIVKHPMDLGTIQRRLEENLYETAAAVATDVRLVWSNCMSYNEQGSDFWILSKSFSRRFEDRYRKLRLECDVGEITPPPELEKTDDSEELVYDEEEPTDCAEIYGSPVQSLPPQPLDPRIAFQDNLNALSGKHLGHVVQKLLEKCPSSLLDGGKIVDKLEIDINQLDETLLEELSSYAERNATRKYSAMPIQEVSNKRSKR